MIIFRFSWGGGSRVKDDLGLRDRFLNLHLNMFDLCRCDPRVKKEQCVSTRATEEIESLLKTVFVLPWVPGSVSTSVNVKEHSLVVGSFHDLDSFYRQYVRSIQRIKLQTLLSNGAWLGDVLVCLVASFLLDLGGIQVA